MNMLDLSVIIINYNTAQLTKDCVESIKKNTKNIGFEIVVVDNASNEKFKIQNAKYKVIYSKTNLGFSGGNNLGMKAAKGKYVLLLNSDTLVHDNVLGEMVKWMDENPKVGVATCSLKNKDDSLQATGGYFPTLPRVFSWMMIQDLPFIDNIVKPFHPKLSLYKSEMELDWITGAFLLTRKEIIDEIGYLDKEYFMYTEDTDFCFRIKNAGWKVIYNPKWSITHFGGASSVKEFPLLSEFRGVKLFYKKHYPNWQYPILRLFLKMGSLWRILFVSPKIYAKAFIEA